MSLSSKPAATKRPRLTIFYDGSCALCRRQAAFWRRLDRAGAVAWRDISRDARALLGTGISHRRALHRLHARTAEGTTLAGARVVAALLREIPRLRLLGELASLPPFIWILDLFYRLASLVRRLVTGRWRHCCDEDL